MKESKEKTVKAVIKEYMLQHDKWVVKGKIIDHVAKMLKDEDQTRLHETIGRALRSLESIDGWLKKDYYKSKENRKCVKYARVGVDIPEYKTVFKIVDDEKGRRAVPYQVRIN